MERGRLKLSLVLLLVILKCVASFPQSQSVGKLSLYVDLPYICIQDLPAHSNIETNVDILDIFFQTMMMTMMILLNTMTTSKKLTLLTLKSI